LKRAIISPDSGNWAAGCGDSENFVKSLFLSRKDSRLRSGSGGIKRPNMNILSAAKIIGRAGGITSGLGRRRRPEQRPKAAVRAMNFSAEIKDGPYKEKVRRC